MIRTIGGGFGGLAVVAATAAQAAWALPGSDGKFRRIALQVRRPGVKLKYRPGYLVPKTEAFR